MKADLLSAPLRLLKLNSVLLLAAALFIPANAFAQSTNAPGQGIKKPKIAYFINQDESNIFWGPTMKFARKTAKDIGVELEVYGANEDHIKLVELVKEAAKKKFDAFVVVDFKDRGPEIVRIAEEAGIALMFENSGIADVATTGKPREKYKHYLGEMVPDDEGAGYNLAKELFKSTKPDSQGKIHVVGINGPKMGCAILRENGLTRAVNENAQVILHQKVSANWESEKAKFQANGLKKRYPEASVVWAANDAMALGAVAGIKDFGAKPGSDVVIGGVDWTPEAIQAIKRGEMTASVGGHIFEAGWVLIALFDYFNGIDFSASEGVNLRCEMSVMTKDNVGTIEAALNPQNWEKVDFKHFSKFYNKDLKKYNFTLDKLVAEIH